MPLDIFKTFDKISTQFANTNYIVQIFGNPFILSIMIVICIILIMYSWDIESELIFRFKFIFYLLLIIIGLMVTHDTILKYKYGESSESMDNDNTINSVNEVASMNEIEPIKDTDLMRANIINDMPKNNVLNSSEILNY